MGLLCGKRGFLPLPPESDCIVVCRTLLSLFGFGLRFPISHTFTVLYMFICVCVYLLLLYILVILAFG